MLVADGLGGLPMEPGGPTELEAAKTPNLDALAKAGTSGQLDPDLARHHPRQRAGTPGPVRLRPAEVPDRPRGLGGHRRRLQAGAEGRGRPLQFLSRSTPPGNITDRRAGRIASEESGPLAIRLREVKIPGVEVFVEPVKEHRFCVIFRGEGLGGNVADTDPQKTGVPPLDPMAARRRQPADRRGRQAVRRAGPEAAGRPAEGQRPDDARLRQRPGPAEL